MPPSSWDHRPKNRARHVAAPPRRRPIIRLMLLAGIGIGLYFGFEPMSRSFGAWMKKPSAPKTPATKPIPDPLKVQAAKASLPEFKSSLKMGNADPRESDPADSGFSWSYKRSSNSDRDSSEITLHCQPGRDLECLEALENRRPGLSPWLAQVLGYEAGAEALPISWQATMHRDIDSGLSEATLASLVQLTLRKGKARTQEGNRGRLVTYRPLRTTRGLRLCPSGGCLEPEGPRRPVGSMVGVQSDEEEQALKLVADMGAKDEAAMDGNQGLAGDTGTQAALVPTKPVTTQLIAPASGWVAKRDTVASQPPQLRLAIDHAHFNRTEFKAPLGAMTLAADMRPGQAVKAGQKVGMATGVSGPVTITWLKQGSPRLPDSWALNPPGDSLAP